MDHALAVVGADDVTKELVHEAAVLAEGVDAKLTLICVTSEEEYEEEREAFETIPKREVNYSIGQALEGARNFAADIGREVVDDVGIEYETAGFVGDRADIILSEARARDCDHVFLTGRRRSPTGKALFGDVTQRVILDFDGPVTVRTS